MGWNRCRRLACAGLGSTLFVVGTVACGHLPSSIGVAPTVWATAQAADDEGDGWIVLDSVSFRPAVLKRVLQGAATSSMPALASSRAAVVTSFQGDRNHPEIIRALAADSLALAATSGLVAARAAMAKASGLLIDLQGMTAADIRALAAVTRAIADSSRKYVLGPIGFVVPVADTAGYPGAIIARSADLIVLRFDGEHRPGTSPGPVASIPWFTRQLGTRAAEVGASRIVAELPLFGYQWQRDGTARRITYEQALAAVLADAIELQRDPLSRSLFALSPRDGWQIWVNDHETVELLISSARRIGVNRFSVAGAQGADRKVWQLLERLGASR